jgi:hypothetical protein
MSIIWDNAIALPNSTGSTSTVSYTAFGTDLELVVGVFMTAPTSTVTGVTANGVALTRLYSTLQGGNGLCEWWHLPNAAEGTYNVVVTQSPTGQTIGGVVSSYRQTDVSSVVDTGAEVVSGASATQTSVPLTTTVAGDWLVGTCWTNRNNSNGTPGTIRAGLTSQFSLYDSNGPITPAGSTNAFVTWSGAATWSANLVAIKPKLNVIEFDRNSGDLGSGTSGNTTVGSLVDGVAMWYVNSSSGVTGVTMNGVAGTLVEFIQPGGGNRCELWVVKLGTVSGSIPWTITGSGINRSAASFFYNVDQTNPVLSSSKTTTAGTNTVSLSGTPTVAGCWGVIIAEKNGACATDSAVHITNRFNTAGGINTTDIGDSNGAVTANVALTQSLTSSGCTQNHGLVQAFIQPVQVVVANGGFFSLF